MMEKEKTDVHISPRSLAGTVSAISSKSGVHRILICAALADKPTEVRFSTLSKDIATTIECLKALGAKIERRENDWIVIPRSNENSGAVRLNCADSGSTLRFLIPVSAALGANAAFTGEGRLPQRPLGPLLSEMEKHGCSFSQNVLPLHLTGRLEPGQYVLPGNISSQYVTGLLLALPLLNGDSSIALTTELESRPYVDMTIATMQKFSVFVETTTNGFRVSGNQAYRSPGSIRAEGDWSNAAFWLCAGALGGPICCEGLELESLQGDRQVLPILREFGATIKAADGHVEVIGGALRGIDIDASAIPDLITALVVVAAAAEGTTTIHHAGRLRMKESDRLSSLAATLEALGARVTELPEGLSIQGGGKLQGGSVDGQGDHRIVMSAAIASVLCEHDVVISGAEAVQKSYPDFFEDFLTLGGDAHVIHHRP